ncbi:hypothetical protein HJFPF1_02638 [Paramyrothecium foliicola]|nr:hypothetical protein HJFPF1_02638 [Paramyrothecium foliicola]
MSRLQKKRSRCSHLAGRDELQRSQGDLEIGSVGLEIVESLSNVLLKLGGVLPRRAVGGDLVQGLGAHLDWWCTTVSVEDVVIESDVKVLGNWKGVAKLGFSCPHVCGSKMSEGTYRYPSMWPEA